MNKDQIQIHLQYLQEVEKPEDSNKNKKSTGEVRK